MCFAEIKAPNFIAGRDWAIRSPPYLVRAAVSLAIARGGVNEGSYRRPKTSLGSNYAGVSQIQEITMAEKSEQPDKEQSLILRTDFLGEDRHEFVAKLAYKLWEERGRPFGSPEVDWFAAERVVYSSLLASGLITKSANDLEHIAEQIYR
jgi:hypothetical protein